MIDTFQENLAKRKYTRKKRSEKSLFLNKNNTDNSIEQTKIRQLENLIFKLDGSK